MKGVNRSAKELCTTDFGQNESPDTILKHNSVNLACPCFYEADPSLSFK